MTQLNDRLAYLTLDLPSGQVIDVVPLTFGRARLCLSASRDALGPDDGW